MLSVRFCVIFCICTILLSAPLQATGVKSKVLQQIETVSEGNNCQCKCVVRAKNAGPCENNSRKTKILYHIDTITNGDGCRCSCNVPPPQDTCDIIKDELDIESRSNHGSSQIVIPLVNEFVGDGVALTFSDSLLRDIEDFDRPLNVSQLLQKTYDIIKVLKAYSAASKLQENLSSMELLINSSFNRFENDFLEKVIMMRNFLKNSTHLDEIQQNEDNLRDSVNETTEEISDEIVDFSTNDESALSAVDDRNSLGDDKPISLNSTANTTLAIEPRSKKMLSAPTVTYVILNETNLNGKSKWEKNEEFDQFENNTKANKKKEDSDVENIQTILSTSSSTTSTSGSIEISNRPSKSHGPAANSSTFLSPSRTLTSSETTFDSSKSSLSTEILRSSSRSLYDPSKTSTSSSATIRTSTLSSTTASSTSTIETILRFSNETANRSNVIVELYRKQKKPKKQKEVIDNLHFKFYDYSDLENESILHPSLAEPKASAENEMPGFNLEKNENNSSSVLLPRKKTETRTVQSKSSTSKTALSSVSVLTTLAASEKIPDQNNVKSSPFATTSTTQLNQVSQTPSSIKANVDLLTTEIGVNFDLIAKSTTTFIPSTSSSKPNSARNKEDIYDLYQEYYDDENDDEFVLPTTTTTTTSTTTTTTTYAVLERQDQCGTLLNLSKPKLVHNFGRREGAWMRDIGGKLYNRNKIYVTNSHYGNMLIEFSSLRNFRNHRVTTTYSLPYHWIGTGHLIYDGSFYFNRAYSKIIVKYDLKYRFATAWSYLRNAVYDSSRSNSWRGHTGLTMAADETNLWVIYPAYSDFDFDSNAEGYTINKVNPIDLEILSTWKITLRRNSVSHFFVVCGVVYATDRHHRRRGRLTYAYDSYTKAKSTLFLPFSNPYSRNVQMLYDPLRKQISSWDNGHQIVYKVNLTH